MHIEQYREYCLSLPYVEESMPFGDEHLVFKVGGKMFTVATIYNFDHFAVKCDPDTAVELRAQHDGVTPAYHFNKKHWNDIAVKADLSIEFQQAQIKASYMLVLTQNVTPKALREEILSTL